MSWLCASELGWYAYMGLITVLAVILSQLVVFGLTALTDKEKPANSLGENAGLTCVRGEYP